MAGMLHLHTHSDVCRNAFDPTILMPAHKYKKPTHS